MNEYKLKRLFVILLLPLSYIVREIAKISELRVENLYSTKIYSLFSQTINIMSGAFSFSIAEIIIYIFIIFIIVFIFAFIVRVLTVEKKDKPYAIYKFLINCVVIISLVYCIFTFTFGINYYRVPFVDKIGLSVDTYELEDLEKLTIDLVNDANAYGKIVERDEAGIMMLSCDYFDIAETAKRAMSKASMKYTTLSGLYTKPKPYKSSTFLSRLGIMGFFFPITLEANVNIDIPDYQLPYTMAHELSHLVGYMQEEEANFLGYLICMESDNDEFKYSATISILDFCLNALLREKSKEYNNIYAKLNESTKADYSAKNQYWQQFEGKTKEISDKVNDTYLKVNDQELGTKSYGVVVDLMIAYNNKNI